MKKLSLVSLVVAAALAISPVVSAQTYDFTYTDPANLDFGTGYLVLGASNGFGGYYVTSGQITFDGITYYQIPGSGLSPSGAFRYDDLFYPNSGPSGYLVDSIGLLFGNSGVNNLEINIWGTGSIPNYILWTGLYNGDWPTQDAGTFALASSVPEYGSLSMLFLSIVGLAGGFFFKARHSGLFLNA